MELADKRMGGLFRKCHRKIVIRFYQIALLHKILRWDEDSIEKILELVFIILFCTLFVQIIDVDFPSFVYFYFTVYDRTSKTAASKIIHKFVMSKNSQENFMF